jgi:hypothetical protein
MKEMKGESFLYLHEYRIEYPVLVITLHLEIRLPNGLASKPGIREQIVFSGSSVELDVDTMLDMLQFDESNIGSGLRLVSIYIFDGEYLGYGLPRCRGSPHPLRETLTTLSHSRKSIYCPCQKTYVVPPDPHIPCMSSIQPWLL